MSTAVEDAVDATGYSARHLSVLEGLDAVRKRPGMYIGSTDSRGVIHCSRRSSTTPPTRAWPGTPRTVEVTCTPTGRSQVDDDGRGIPTDIERQVRAAGVELVLTRLHAGGKFGGSGYKTSGGLHGVGASAVNALSRAASTSRSTAAGKVHEISFQRGVPGVFDGAGPERAVHARVRPAQGQADEPRRAPAPRSATGTTPATSGPAPASTSTACATKLRNTAFLVPGLSISVRDERGESGRRRDVPLSTVGDMVEFLDPGRRPAGLRHAAASPARARTRRTPPTTTASMQSNVEREPRSRSRSAGAPATTRTVE